MDTEDDSLSTELQNIADTQGALIMSFVAPDRAVRVSPVGVYSVSIDIDDLYEIEKVIERLEESRNLPKKLHLVIQTPGGLVHVTTKIANYLRRAFKEVYAFVSSVCRVEPAAILARRNGNATVASACFVVNARTWPMSFFFSTIPFSLPPFC